MSGIAEVLLNLGFEVSGSDLAKSATTNRLEKLGGKVVEGHDAKNIKDADVVVISSAVKQDNPEVVAARYEGVPVIPRAEMLSELMRMKRGIAVAGSHGKTTTTSMIAALLAETDIDPTAIIGGKLNIYGGSNAKLGQGNWLLAEADESDGSFMQLSPTVVVVTNIDREHMDFYKSIDALHETFVKFMNGVPFYGLVVACIDDPVVRSLIPKVQRRVLTYGVSGDADIRALEITCAGNGCSFAVVQEGIKLGNARLEIPGEHNAVNALAALAVAFELGMKPADAFKAIDGFTGIGRRFELKGEVAGVKVIDDYGHHPTEIMATLKAAHELLRSRNNTPEKRLIVAFQPHRYSRTKDLWDDFIVSFYDADLLILTDIYAASESPINGISGESLFKAVSKLRQERGLPTKYATDVDQVAGMLISEAGAGDVVMTLGAGSIWRAGEQLLKRLEDRE